MGKVYNIPVKRFFLFFFLLILQPVFSQQKNKIVKYYEYLRYPAADAQSTLFFGNYQYSLSPVGKTFGAQGTILNLGINLSRLFNNKIIFGVTADFKLIPGFSAKKLTNEFTQDFNDSFIGNYNSPLDSANSFVISKAINRDGSYIRGNNVFNIGIAISLFPQKYGGVLLQIKYGNRGFNVHGRIYGNKFIENGGRDFYSIGMADTWTGELSVKPVSFFKNTFFNVDSSTFSNFIQGFVISIYYERLKFNDAEFNSTKISSMLDSNFNRKYSIDNRFGIKIGFSIY